MENDDGHISQMSSGIEDPYQQYIMAQDSYRPPTNNLWKTNNDTSTNVNPANVSSQTTNNKGRREAHRIKPGESIMALDRHMSRGPRPPPPRLCSLRYLPQYPHDFNQDKLPIAKQFYEEIMAGEPRDNLFYNQALLILKNNSSKRCLKTIDHQSISSADEVTIVHRNPRGQIYFMKDLHLCVHFTISQAQRKVVDFVFEGKKVVNVQPSENIIREHFAVWNKDDWNAKGDGHRFLSDTSKLIEKLFPGFQDMMKIPQKGDSRGTIAANIGLSVNDCNQYGRNRLTIFGTIRPSLIKLDCVQDACALRSLGKLVVYTFKHILPALGQHQHFQLPIDIKAGAARFQLRRNFAKSLHVDEEEDYSYFLAEAISIIIPIIVYPHRDSSNDTSENQSGTVTINCSLHMNIITNKKLKTCLQHLGYKDTFPCSVILYSRACCGSYFRRVKALSKLENENPIGKVIVSSIEIGQERDEKDYIGRIFDNTDYLAGLIRKMKQRDSSEYIGSSQIIHHEQQSDEQNELGDASKKRITWSKSIHLNNVIDIVPFSYDVMSKWSIVFDCALEIHFHLKPLTAETIVLYIMCVVIYEIHDVICAIHQELISGDLGEAGFTRLATKMHLLLGRKRGLRKSQIISLQKNILECLHSTRVRIISSKKKTKIKRVLESCDYLLQDLVYESRDIASLNLNIQEGKDCIHLAALFGLLPLECIAWASVHPHDKLSEKIIELTGIHDSHGQQGLFQCIYRYSLKKISNQSTGTLLQNILLSHNRKNLQSHYYYFHPHRNAIQHFYRAKKTESQWELQMLCSSPFTWKSCLPRTTTVTTWNSADEKFMNWQLVGNRITCSSSLIVSDEFKEVFFSNFEVNCRHAKKKRIEESCKSITLHRNI